MYYVIRRRAWLSISEITEKHNKAINTINTILNQSRRIMYFAREILKSPNPGWDAKQLPTVNVRFFQLKIGI
jgi:hypothetical protein